MTKRVRRPTMVDVGRAAGVSQSTVSFVLNHVQSVRITEATRNRVWQAARELGYSAAPRGNRLTASAMRVIGLIVDRIESAVARQVIHGARDAAWLNRHLLTVTSTNGDIDLTREVASLLLGQRVDGLIFLSAAPCTVDLGDLLPSGATVLVNCTDASVDYDDVGEQESACAEEAMRHLARAGHQRTLVAASDFRTPRQATRLARITQVAHSFGIDVIQSTTAATEDANGQRVSCSHALAPGQATTAALCLDTASLADVYRGAMLHARRIHDDLSVLGIGPQRMCSMLDPQPRMLAIDYAAMGQRAVSRLIGKPDGSASSLLRWHDGDTT